MRRCALAGSTKFGGARSPRLAAVVAEEGGTNAEVRQGMQPFGVIGGGRGRGGRISGGTIDSSALVGGGSIQGERVCLSRKLRGAREREAGAENCCLRCGPRLSGNIVMSVSGYLQIWKGGKGHFLATIRGMNLPRKVAGGAEGATEDGSVGETFSNSVWGTLVEFQFCRRNAAQRRF